MRRLNITFLMLVIVTVLFTTSPFNVNAQTVDSLLEQLEELQLQVFDMEKQLQEILESGKSSFTSFYFIDDLSIGDSGNTVTELQQALKQNGVYTGPVTGYFGLLTEAGVFRFQEKYADEILKPLDLTRGTGYFGKSTRAKLNKILGASASPSFTINNPEEKEITIETILSGTDPFDFDVFKVNDFVPVGGQLEFEDGDQVTLSWRLSNHVSPVSCNISDDKDIILGTNLSAVDTFTIQNPSIGTTYYVNCIDGTNTYDWESINIIKPIPQPPSVVSGVSINLTINNFASFVKSSARSPLSFSWTTTGMGQENATPCFAETKNFTGNKTPWTGVKSSSGEESYITSGSGIFRITCTTSSGIKVSDEVKITQAPFSSTVFSFDKFEVNGATVNWALINHKSPAICNISDNKDKILAKNLSAKGSFTILNPIVGTTYNINCTDGANTNDWKGFQVSL